MAKIVASFDTDSKTLTVNVDGESINNVSGVSFYTYENYEGEKHTECSINTHEKSDTGVSKMTSYYAKASKKGRELVKSAHADLVHSLKGFIGVEEVDVTTDVANFLDSKMKLR